VSYDQIKRQRQQELLASLHPGFPINPPSDKPATFDGGIRGELPPPPPPLPWPFGSGWIPTDEDD
jgi:hypothetical protein